MCSVILQNLIGSFVITVEMESWSISCYKGAYRYFNHLLTPGLCGPARNAAPFSTEADSCCFTLYEKVFSRGFLYFWFIYHQTKVSSVTLNGINVASTLQVCAPSILILILGGELSSTKAEVTSLVQQTMFSFRYKMRKYPKNEHIKKGSGRQCKYFDSILIKRGGGGN